MPFNSILWMCSKAKKNQVRFHMYHVPCQFADKTYRSAVWNIHWWTLRAFLLHWTPKKSTHEATTSKNQRKKRIITKTFHSLKRMFSKWFFILAPLKGPDPLGDTSLRLWRLDRRLPLGRMPVVGYWFSPCPAVDFFFLVLTSMRNVAKKDRKRLYQFFGEVILR